MSSDRKRAPTGQAAARLKQARAARSATANTSFDPARGKGASRGVAIIAGFGAAAALAAVALGLAFVLEDEPIETAAPVSLTEQPARRLIRFGPGGDVSPPPPVVFGSAVDPDDVASRLISDRAFADAAEAETLMVARIGAPAPAADLDAITDPIDLLSSEAALTQFDDRAPPELTDGLNIGLANRLGAGFRMFEDKLANANAREELDCLAEAVYFEARGEPLEGRVAVAEVILNRADSAFWPDTVCDVISQGSDQRNACQFSYKCDGKPEEIDDRPAYRAALTLAEFMMQGAPRRRADGATHYHAASVSPDWAGALEQVAEVGQHIFYRRVMDAGRRPPG